MGKVLDPEKYHMAFCPLCEGKGRFPKKDGDFDVCKECGGFGLIKRETEISEEGENKD
jgi:DnaJ-class molecular chaperone